MRSLPCLSAAAVLCALALPLGARPVAARVCLPPLYEGGQRLLPLTDVRVMWLEPLLRQHELCWRERGHEVRIALFGNSAVFGYPLPVEQSFAARINAQFAADHVPAHLFNLGWVFTYQVRVYALTLADMMHVAPADYPPPLGRFFELNTDTLAALSEAPPPGLTEPFELYRPVAARAPWLVAAERVRQLGYLAHSLAHTHADVLVRRFGAEPRPPRRPFSSKPKPYECAKTLSQNDLMFADFERWNTLEYLADIQAQSGRTVLVVNWPIAHEPQQGCYNRRYGVDLIRRYNRWLADETARLGLAYIDLQELLPPDQFIDSLHVNAAGHQRIAEHVGAALTPVVQARYSALSTRAAHAEARP